MILKIKYKEKFISVPCEKVNFWRGFCGLMFKKTCSKNLYFDYAPNIHSLFVFNNFLAVWLNGKKEVVKVNLVRPFRLMIKRPFGAKKLVEIPMNEKNKKIIEEILKEE